MNWVECVYRRGRTFGISNFDIVIASQVVVYLENLYRFYGGLGWFRSIDWEQKGGVSQQRLPNIKVVRAICFSANV